MRDTLFVMLLASFMFDLDATGSVAMCTSCMYRTSPHQ